ncbi:MAG: hypothetical protein AAFY17_10250 [Cyanobacteria bacterium J06642_11]
MPRKAQTITTAVTLPLGTRLVTYAVGHDRENLHGAGVVVHFHTKAEGGPAGEEPERIDNDVRLVHDVSN